MLFGRKKEAEIPLLSEQVLKQLRSWRHPEIFPGQHPVATLRRILAEQGRAAYDLACTELLTAMRTRFRTRPGYNILITVYFDFRNGTMLSIAPSPRKGEDCIEEGGRDGIHPIPVKEIVNAN